MDAQRELTLSALTLLLGLLLVLLSIAPGCSQEIETCAQACAEVNECLSGTNCNVGGQPCDLCRTSVADSFLQCVKSADSCSDRISCASSSGQQLPPDAGIDWY